MAASYVRNVNEIAMEQAREGVDIISFLPKDLIDHILSFLPTKHVVQTCALSKKWQNLWKSIRHLDFVEELFYMDGDNLQDPVLKFSKFVNTFFILFEGSNIETFRLSCSSYCDLDCVFTWIRAAVKYQVQEVEINIESEDRFSLPHCLFACPSLKVLKVHFHGCPLMLPASAGLPQLKMLSLRSVKFEDNNLSRLLLSNCPNLENLNLKNCELDLAGPSFDIAASNLKVLVLNSFPWSDFAQTGLDFKIKIVAPKLESLVYNGIIAPEYHFPSLLPSLQNASFDLRPSDWHNSDISSSVLTMLRAITSVTILHLSDLTIWILSSDEHMQNHLPLFRYLSELNLSSVFNKRQVLGIARLLQNAPNLELLKLEITQNVTNENSTEILGPNELCSDLLLCNLKVVEIKNISLNRNHVMFVRLILTSAGNLERLTVVMSGLTLIKRRQLKRCIERLPRLSTNCVIQIRRCY